MLPRPSETEALGGSLCDRACERSDRLYPDPPLTTSGPEWMDTERFTGSQAGLARIRPNPSAWMIKRLWTPLNLKQEGTGDEERTFLTFLRLFSVLTRFVTERGCSHVDPDQSVLGDVVDVGDNGSSPSFGESSRRRSDDKNQENVIVLCLIRSKSNHLKGSYTFTRDHHGTW